MSRVKWNLADLHAKKKKLESLVYNVENLKDINLISESVVAYTQMIGHAHIRTMFTPFTEQYYDDDIETHEYLSAVFDEDFDTYPWLSEEVVDMLIKSTKAFNASNLGFGRIPHKTCVMNNEILIAHVDAIFKSVGSTDLYKSFKSLMYHKPSLVDIEYLKPTISRDFSGASFFDVYNHIPYTKILRDNTIGDIVTLVHELFHMIIKKHSHSLSYYGPRYIYNEVEGHIGDFLATDYLYNFTKQQDMKFDLNVESNNSYRLVESYARNAGVVAATFASFGEHQHLRIKDIRKRINQMGMTARVRTTNIQGYISDDFEYESYVAFAYLIALDVYKIFKKDPDKGLYLLRRISELDGVQPKQELSNLGITFFEDGHQSVKEKGFELVKRWKETKCQE